MIKYGSKVKVIRAGFYEGVVGIVYTHYVDEEEGKQFTVYTVALYHPVKGNYSELRSFSEHELELIA
jgi:hypothetical protein